jgi:hypothetical protein
MVRRAVGPCRSDSLQTYVRSTRIIGGLSVLVLSGAVVWDLANDGFWSRHALFTSLVASLIAESLDRSSFDLAMRIVPTEWWAAQLPDRPSTAENHRT